MPDSTTSADGTRAPALTVADAEKSFAGLLTPPKEHEERREPSPQGESEADAEATPSPEERPDQDSDKSDEAETAGSDDSPIVKITDEDGHEHEVSQRELEAHWVQFDKKVKSADADYTRKTQAAAELRKHAETEATAAREQRTQYQEQLGQLRKALESLMPPEPDWDTLRREEPSEYAIRKLEWNDHQERIRSVKAAEQQVAWEQAQDQSKQLQAKVVEEQDKLLAIIPDWKDTAKARAEMDRMRAHGKTYGFTDDDLNQISDHRAVLALRDAMRYAELQAKRPKAQQRIQQVKAATPGGLKTPEKGASYKRALEQLAKSGRKDDAALAFQQLGASEK